MDNSEIQLVGSPCGQHGPYTFYKAFKYVKNGAKRIMTLSEFFFVKLWMDSDLVCIGELQLLWVDKNSEQVLASLRLYFLPENTPEGRMDHGEDEVLAISEKVVLRVEDLITWITMDAEWSWGRFVKSLGTILEYCTRDILVPTTTLTETSLDFSDVQKERLQLDNDRKHRPTNTSTVPNVVVLSYPRYCRYRAIMRRLDGVADITVRHQVVTALGGHGTAGGGAVTAAHNTRVLFCKDTFDYPELEGHELLCNHLAPKLKGRPRGKRKKRSISPGGSESNESEESSSVCGGGGGGGSSSKVLGKITTQGGRNGLRCDTTTSPRRSTRSIENMESKNFLKKLTSFMKTNRTPMGRIPSLGYKELDLYGFYNKVQKLGGYDAVTSNRMWKSIFDDLSLSGASTSAATVIRRHYERFLLAYERKQKGEEYKPLPVSERRRLKSKAGSSSASDVETSEGGTSRSGNSTPVPQLSGTSSNPSTPTDNKEFNISKSEVKTSSLRSVRVKSERMRDTTTTTTATATTIKDKPSLEKCLSLEEPPAATSPSPSPSKTDLALTTTESSTHLLLPPPPRPVVSVEDTKELIKDIHDRHNNLIMDCQDVTNRNDTTNDFTNSIDVKLKTEDIQFSSTDVVECLTVMTTDCQQEDVKEIVDTKEMKPLLSKHSEPVTTAIAPIQKATTPAAAAPVAEGKENIPLFNSPLIPDDDDEDLIEVPYKPATPEIIDLESDEFVSKTPATEVKRGKLEILKEGGLEVTPVKQLHFVTTPPPPPLSQSQSQVMLVAAAAPTTSTTTATTTATTMATGLESPFIVVVDDSRPSVIRQAANSPHQQISISMTAGEKRKVPMPPPPTTINATLTKKARTPTPPVVRAGITPPPSPHQAASPKAKISHHAPPVPFNEHHTPPKVIHQSKSIYSPHERTVYGDPKLLFPPSPITNHHLHHHHNNTTTPKLLLSQPKQAGGATVVVDILDLTLRSPQKPTVEITRVPNVPALPLHSAAAATTKGLYKLPQHLQQAVPLPDVSRFGSNLEITLVAGNQSKKQSTKHSNSNSKNSYHKPPSQVTNNNHKRSHSESSTGSGSSSSANKHGRMMFCEDNTNGRRSHQNNNDKPSPRNSSSKTTATPNIRNLEINIPNPYSAANRTTSSASTKSKSDTPLPNNKTPNHKTPNSNSKTATTNNSKTLTNNSKTLTNNNKTPTTNNNNNNNSTSYGQQQHAGSMFPPYLTQTTGSSSSNGSSNGKSVNNNNNTQQGLPASIIDSMYYQQLLQNWYQPNAGLAQHQQQQQQSMQPPAGMFQMPTAEHMQLYNNLIAYNARIRMPFPMMMTDGNNASIMNSDSAALNKQ